MQANGDWMSSSGKQFFAFEITLDGNISGQVNAVSPDPWFSIGMVVEYEITGQSPRGETKLKIRKPGSDFSGQDSQKQNVPAYPKNFVQDTERNQQIRKMWALKTAAHIKGPQELTQREELDYCNSLKSLAQCLLIALDSLENS